MAPTPWSASSRTLFGFMVFAWGANYLFVRVGLGYATPLWLAALRAGIGTLGIAVYLLVRNPPIHLDRRGRRDALLLGVPNTAVFFGLWFVAARAVPAGEAAVVVYTFPLWVSLLSSPVLHRRLTRFHWLAVGVGFGGVVLISQPGATGTTPRLLLALVELVAAAVSWAVATVLFQRRFRAEEMPSANAYQLLGGAAALVAAALIVDPTALPGPAPTLWISALWLGLAGSAFGYATWFFLLGRVEAADLSAYAFCVPVTALGLSAIFLGERPSVLQAVGVALVLTSIYLVARSSVVDSGPAE